MSKYDIETAVEQNAKNNIQIAGELADIVEYLVTNGYYEGNGVIETPTLKKRCPEATYNRLRRLEEEIGIVQGLRDGPERYLIHTRLDEIVNDGPVSRMVDEELSRIEKHAKKDPGIRRVISRVRASTPTQALNGLKQGTFPERRKRLENTVRAIQADASVSQGDYGMIIFRKSPVRWQATHRAVTLYRR